ncbi:MAG: ribonuclease R, partial [Acidaminobacteraceae bacterium]
YKLGVHIADVSYYVTERSELDKEALKRATSVYLIDRVIPMLPERLSNGICSLNPHVNRLTMSCEMEIDPNGSVVNHDIFESVIKTSERMTYNDVSDILEGKLNDELTEKYEYLFDTFKVMEELCKILRARRDARGAIDFNFPEPQIILDENGSPIDIIRRERRIANRVIEEFMLVANETVAEHFHWLEIPFVYRVHEPPTEEKITNFNKFIHNFGYTIKGSLEEVSPKSIQKLLLDVEGEKEEQIISKLMLRSLKQAKYTPINEGHFGLAADYYSHFTSPIRRYPDLQIHRIIREHIQGKLNPTRIERLKSIVTESSKQASEQERVAEKAERDVDDMKMAEYALQFIGEEFDGMISSVTGFGMFIELENTMEGLTRISELKDDYYIYDEDHLRLIGEKTKKVYSVGDSVKIVIVGANVDQREIDFAIIEKIER